MSTMQVSDLNYPGFKLPTVIEPPDSLCFQINVPNDEGHIAAFFGAIFELSQWISWQRDVDKRGKDAAAVWRKIYLNLKAQQCAIPITAHGTEQEDFMPLRVDCDCNVYVTCCDGTEKQILTSDQVKALINSQPGAGTPQPPAGGCQTYHGSIPAPLQFLVPFPVSTGDVITIKNATGSVHDGQDARWFCPDGGVFFAGGNTEIFIPAASLDPLSTARHCQTIIEIAGTFYDILPDTPFTVPSGVSLVQPTIQANLQTTTASGNFDFDVEVCNNRAASWTHTFDFSIAPTPFSIIGTGGSWVGGAGFEGGPLGSSIGSRLNFTATADFAVDTIQLTYDSTDCLAGGAEITLYNASSGVLQDVFDTLATGTSVSNRIWNETLSQTGVRRLELAQDSNPSGGANTMKKMIITGHGFDPF